MQQRSLAVVVLVGLVGFLYPLVDVLSKIQDWSVIWDPPNVSQLVFCAVCGLVAVGGALGLDIPALVQGFKKQP